MQPPDARSGTRKLRVRFGPRTAVLALLLVGVSAELLLARKGFGNPRLVRGDERRGYALVGEQVIRGPRGTTERINAAGFREREWVDAPIGRPLVVVLGHSVSYGVGVESEERWTTRLESRLRAGAAPGACVLDLAVPGYTLEQMLAVYEELARPMQPEAVVLDLADYSIRPMLGSREPADFPLSRWVRRTALFDFLRRKVVRLEGDEALIQSVVEDPAAEVHEPLWRAAFERLEGLRAELAGRGARLVFLHTPSAAAVLETRAQPSRWHAWCAERPDVLELDCTGALRERMADLLAEFAERGVEPRLSSWRVARLEPAEFAARESACFFLDDPLHLTALGHGIVGERAAQALGPLLLPPVR